MIAVDGSAIDMATISVGALCVFIRPMRRRINNQGACFTRRTCVMDFLNGATLVPFVLLIGSIFSSTLLQEALKSNKIAMGLAGFAGLIFILGELFVDKPA